MRQFNDQQMQDFATYEEVRQDGAVNMFSREAMFACGFTKAQHLFVIENYRALKAQWEQEAKV